jgi:hypothetical protein
MTIVAVTDSNFQTAKAIVIASAAKQSIAQQADRWIASRSLSSGAHSRGPMARNDDET